jgi:hypothetical protein
MVAEPASTSRLLRAFTCSVDDLVANRSGSLTTRQQHLLAQHIAIGSRSSCLAVLVFLGSVAFLLIGAPFLINDGSVPQQVLPYLVVTALVVLGIVGVSVGIGMRRIQMLRRAQISVIQGSIRRTTKRFRQGRWTAYYLWIGGMRFQLMNQQQYNAFVEGRSYCIYYIHYPPTQLILSLEELPGL